MTIGELRETISRFLSKVQNAVVPVPTVQQLPEKIHSLDIEITEMMKSVSAMATSNEDEQDEASVVSGKDKGNQSFGKMAGETLRGTCKLQSEELEKARIFAAIRRFRSLRVLCQLCHFF